MGARVASHAVESAVTVVENLSVRKNRRMLRPLITLFLLSISFSACALKTTAPADMSLDGRWSLNQAASEDGEALLAKRMEEEMKDMRRREERRRRQMQNDPFAWEPEFGPLSRTPQNLAAQAERDRDLRQMLGMTKFLNIKQTDGGAKVSIQSEYETRRYDAGSRSQVSLPQGQLADSQSGWEREWFVIERRSRGGPRITEKYRLLKKTDQLELQTIIKGDSMLSGMNLRQVFDRVIGEPVAAGGPSAGPVR
jgi:hypothetical protein